METKPDMDSVTRRGVFIFGAGAVAAGLPPLGTAAAAASADAILEDVFQAQLEMEPERATELGLDVGPLASLRGRLSQRSADGRRHAVESAERSLHALRQLPPGEQRSINVRVAAEMLEDTLRRADFDYASLRGMSTPYPISILTGAYQAVPDLLSRQQPLSDAADGAAYLSRLSAFAPALDQDTAVFEGLVAEGAGPPRFLLEMTLLQLKSLRAVAPEASVYVKAIQQRGSTLPQAAKLAADAETIVAGTTYPALDRQIAALEKAQDAAPQDAGVWRLPKGDAYYAVALRTETTTRLSPDEVHAMGFEEASRINQQLDVTLRQLGLDQGAVSDRLNALSADPANYYSNDEAGRAALMAAIQAQITHTYARLPKYFHRFPPSSLEVRRIPAFQEAGYPGGSYVPAPLNHSRPATFSMNLGNMHDRPSFGFPTLTFHETVPGHHLQIGVAQGLTNLPSLRRFSEFSAYTEGWGVYAEGLGMELGVPDLGRYAYVGYLQSMLFRAARLVVDTGLHAKRWAREHATDEMVRISGLSRPRAQREVDRYCVFPGQACSYMVGCRTWRDLRAKAKGRDGEAFDIRDFHDLLSAGPMPLDILADVAAARPDGRR